MFDNLTKIFQNTDFKYLVKSGLLRREANLSSVIESFIGEETSDQEYSKICLEFLIFDVIPKTKKDSAKTFNIEDLSTLLENWIFFDLANQHPSKIAEGFSEMSVRFKKYESNLKERRYDIFHGLNPNDKQEIENIKLKYLSSISRVRSYFGMYNIHRELGYLKTLLMLLGNLMAQNQHINVQNYLYSPELVQACMHMVSNPYCLDIMYLSFTALVTIPPKCTPLSPRRRAQGRPQHRRGGHREGARVRRQEGGRLPV